MSQRRGTIKKDKHGKNAAQISINDNYVELDKHIIEREEVKSDNLPRMDRGMSKHSSSASKRVLIQSQSLDSIHPEEWNNIALPLV